ncbi:MAG TPA: LacI family DNA-binding transcriptional regulator [Steroidobacteraceae bacterium]|nr:LacI family DNA-binding transcriptional regulator [Steroidobacteraceae bacterium]
MTEEVETAERKRDISSPSTIHDVAKAAGVSARTVSRVINDLPRVSRETRERIQQVIRDLNFSPNMRARALANSRSYLLGLVHNDPNSENVDQLHRGVFRVCVERHYEVIAHPLETDGNIVEDVLSFVRRSRVDGLIVMAPSSEDDALARALHENRIPAVAVAAAPRPYYDLVLVSRERDASSQVAKHLLNLGHRRFGFISGPLDQISARERQEGFFGTLANAGVGIAPELICEGDYSFESGLKCARQLLDRSSRPTAIYACNDRMAAGVLQVASELRIQVPEQLSVVGFDNAYLASVLNPALTTIHRPMNEIGCRAAEWLVDRPARADGPHTPQTELVDLKLVERRSTGRVAGPDRL